MELKEYKTMYNIEDGYWWYLGMRELVFSQIERMESERKSPSILDTGCGTGKVLEACKDFRAYGIDISEEALRFCNLRKLNNILQASICDIPFKNGSFDMVISLDVIVCMDIEHDMKIFNELYRALRRNGVLVLNLPAYNFLKSSHDRAVHCKHRYTANEVKRKLERAGFMIETLTYRNTFLFPVAFVKRSINKVIKANTGKAESDLKPLPHVINKMFTYLLHIENKLIASGFRFPFGLSVYCVARKLK
jgi:SAM-dependent methyltransferase